MAIYTENSVFRIFRAIGFMVSVATIAQELDHHPNWSNVSNKVNVRLNTHDVGGLTRLDFELAKRMISLQRATRRVERTMASPAKKQAQRHYSSNPHLAYRPIEPRASQLAPFTKPWSKQSGWDRKAASVES